MATPSYDSTGFYSSFTFPSYTPPPGAPSKKELSSLTPKETEARRAQPMGGPSAGSEVNGMVNSHFVPRADPPVALRRAPAPPAPNAPSHAPPPPSSSPLQQQQQRGGREGLVLPRTNSPIHAPSPRKVQQLGCPLPADAHSGRPAGHTRTPPKHARHDSRKTHRKRRNASPKLVSATTRTDARASPWLQSDLVRTPSSKSLGATGAFYVGSGGESHPQPHQLRQLDNEDGLRNTLQALNNECHDLLSMLDAEALPGADPYPRETIDSAVLKNGGSDDAPTRNTCTTDGRTTSHLDLEGAMVEAGHESLDRLALKWALFLIDNRLQRLQRVHQHRSAASPSSSTAELSERLAFEAATKAASNTRDALLSLEECVGTVGAGGLRDLGDVAGLQRHKQLCVTVANGLANLALAEDEVFAKVLGSLPEQRLSGDDALNASSSSRPGTPRAQTPPQKEAEDRSTNESEEVREAFKKTALLLCELKTENTALKDELQDTLRKREKTKRHLKREREEKDKIAQHFNVVAGDNAELHRRVRQLEEELAEQERKCEALMQKGGQRPLTDEERAAAEARNEEYNRLKAQMERQVSHLQDLRNELLSSERENDTLRNTIGQLRDSLVRHRTVIDLLTRDQLSPSPLPDRNSVGRSSPRPERGPPMRLIEGILDGTVSLPSSSLSP